MAKRSVQLNEMQDKIEIINCNIKEFLNNKRKENNKIDNDIIEKKHKKLSMNEFDFIVTNPPYKN